MTAAIVIGVGAIVGVAFFLVLGLPILRGRGEASEDGRGEALKARLAEIDRDRASGLMSGEDADAAIIEAKRAALASAPDGKTSTARFWRFAAVAFAALAPAAIGGLYFAVGAPALLNPKPVEAAATAPNAEAIAAMPAEDRQAMIEGMVASLAARLEEAPEDPEGWRMLARSQLVLGRPADAAGSFRRLLAIDAGTADDWRNFATALVASMPEGRFPSDAEFLGALDKLEGFDAGDPMVLFYRGGAAREAGDRARAVELWSILLEQVPADAPARRTLEALIAETLAPAP